MTRTALLDGSATPVEPARGPGRTDEHSDTAVAAPAAPGPVRRAPASTSTTCRYFAVGDTTVKALDQVNLHVDEAAFVVVLGASGSGKTTSLTWSAGLTFDSGSAAGCG